jgi:sugar phosphate isomerase/epimerase
MDKREFLKKMGLLTAGGMVAGSIKPASAAAMVGRGKKEIGLQIYSVMRELNADVPNGLKKIKDIGYSTIELAGYGNRKMGEYSVEEYRKLADDAGLKITGSHVNPPTRDITKDKLGELADFWKKTVEDHVKFGVKTLVQPMMPNVPT